MLAECLAALNPQPGQIIVDCTLGLAGHSAELLRRIGPGGLLIAMDLDGTHLGTAEARLRSVGHPFVIRRGNFASLHTPLLELGIDHVHGVLADLGMSSMQVDDPSRGFSHRRDGPLDMRMDHQRGPTAADLLAELSEADLAAAFAQSDEPQAEAIAAAIIRQRRTKPLLRTSELRAVVEAAAPVRVIRSPGAGSPRKQKLAPVTRVFQALRLLVNRELSNLQQLLRVLPMVLAPDGVAAIISFHSGEDRLVKAAFRQGRYQGIYSAVTDDPIRPSDEETRANPRARSAKLRHARRATFSSADTSSSCTISI